MSDLEENTTDDQETTPESEAAVDQDDDLLNIGQERVLELISYLVVNLVEHPDDVTVDIVRRQDRDVYQVRVNEADLGKVIGKGGQTAQAMRVLLTAVSAHTDQRIGLEIVE
ncbi:MAG: KH domain-containing protein [Candidatus Krumholzibacteria bacterium]|nr:KH domain-containing protein [Candidatus Krumholzibacteria bacterium]